MQEITFKIPVGSEEKVREMVAVAVERFLREQMAETPVEEKPEYKTAVDTFRADNKMELKFAKVEEPKEEILEVVDKEVVIEEKVDDSDTSINNTEVL